MSTTRNVFIGCGLGTSAVLLAQEYPNFRFTGSDYHDQSIEIARKRADDDVAGNLNPVGRGATPRPPERICRVERRIRPRTPPFSIYSAAGGLPQDPGRAA